MPQLDKCLKLNAFQGVILYRIQSLSSPRIDLNFRHLSSCDTIDSANVGYSCHSRSKNSHGLELNKGY